MTGRQQNKRSSHTAQSLVRAVHMLHDRRHSGGGTGLKESCERRCCSVAAEVDDADYGDAAFASAACDAR